MFSKDLYAKAQVSSTVDGEALAKEIWAALEEADQNAQYDAIKGLVASNRDVAALKKFMEITDYMSTHQMRWALINMFNAA